MRIVDSVQFSQCIVDMSASMMSDAVIDLLREGCETLEFQVGEINPHSVGHAFQVR